MAAYRSSTVSTKRVSRWAALAMLMAFAVPATKAQQAPNPAGQAGAPATSAPPPVSEGELPQVLHLLVGRSLVIASPTRIKRVSLADPAIAEALVVSPYQGCTERKGARRFSFLLWDENEQTQTFEVSVDIDILGLAQKIHQQFPTEAIQLEGAGDVVMISGKGIIARSCGKNSGICESRYAQSDQFDGSSLAAHQRYPSRSEIR